MATVYVLTHSDSLHVFSSARKAADAFVKVALTFPIEHDGMQDFTGSLSSCTNGDALKLARRLRADLPIHGMLLNGAGSVGVQPHLLN